MRIDSLSVAGCGLVCETQGFVLSERGLADETLATQKPRSERLGVERSLDIHELDRGHR